MARTEPKRTLNNAAERQCVDHLIHHPDDQDDQPTEVHTCYNCVPWHAEIFVTGHPQLRTVWLREWHAVGCPSLLEEMRFIREELHADGCPEVDSSEGCTGCSPGAHHRRPPLVSAQTSAGPAGGEQER